MDRLFLYKLMDNNSFIYVCIHREIETSTLPVAVGRTKPKEENHRPLIYQTLLLYQRVHLQDKLVVLLEGLLLVVGVLLLFVQLLAHVLDQLLHGEVEHQLEDVGGHHPTLDHLVHASYLGDQGVVAREACLCVGPLKEEAVATAAAVVHHCCLVNHSLLMCRPIKGRSSSNSSSISSPLLPRKP